MIIKNQFEKTIDEARAEGFARWMKDPMARAMISTIPPCENLEVLLQGCFESGFANGSVSATIGLMDAMLTRSSK